MTTAQQTETAEERVARLELRLHDGFTKIGEAMSKGVAVENWERHWLELLKHYVGLEDELQARPPAEPVQQELAGLPVRRRVEEGVR